MHVDTASRITNFFSRSPSKNKSQNRGMNNDSKSIHGGVDGSGDNEAHSMPLLERDEGGIGDDGDVDEQVMYARQFYERIIEPSLVNVYRCPVASCGKVMSLSERAAHRKMHVQENSRLVLEQLVLKSKRKADSPASSSNGKRQRHH
eukprot:TRINITY_DN56386_c0_g1_i1.p1 TRINITY_DN56386_c0_g1~~TRINITY_DN56386_c0_g1_i1.p1  ORF type:complete len:147 (+),score=76.20 TRINITY_DN56386_c0_g1_i1:72-512(+)